MCFLAGSGSGGRGTGTFYLDEVVGTGTRPWGLVRGDFTGDQLADYVALSYLQAGATSAQLSALQRLGQTPEAIAADPVFDATQQAVLQLVVEMTRQVQVRDTTYARARAALGSDQAMFEVIGITAAYNMVSRILVATQLHP